MTMRKVRAQALRKAHRKMLESLTRRHRPRVDVAIDSCWSLRAPPERILDMQCELICLRAQIIAATVREKDDISPQTFLLIARNVRRINLLTGYLKRRVPRV